jgi:hypothetical protein
MKRTNLISILTSLIVIGIFAITAPALTSCGGGECDHDHDSIACTDSMKAEHDCEHHKKDHDCDHHKNDSTKCDHGKNHHCADMSGMKEDRIAFDELLSDEEKAEIKRIKGIFAEINHEETTCDQVQEKYAEEIAAIQAIVDAHADDFKPICEKKHEGDKEHKCKDMTEEEKKAHCNQFKIHFLLMDTCEKAEETDEVVE